MSQYTPEPWEAHITHGVVCAPNGRSKYKCMLTRTDIIRVNEIDFARASKCVNACAGIEDPAAYIADLQSRLDLAVKALEELMNSIPENRPLYKDSGLWQVRSDDMEYVYFQQGVNETFLEFVNRVTQIKGGADENG